MFEFFCQLFHRQAPADKVKGNAWWSHTPVDVSGTVKTADHEAEAEGEEEPHPPADRAPDTAPSAPSPAKPDRSSSSSAPKPKAAAKPKGGAKRGKGKSAAEEDPDIGCGTSEEMEELDPLTQRPIKRVKGRQAGLAKPGGKRTALEAFNKLLDGKQ